MISVSSFVLSLFFILMSCLQLDDGLDRDFFEKVSNDTCYFLVFAHIQRRTNERFVLTSVIDRCNSFIGFLRAPLEHLLYPLPL